MKKELNILITYLKSTGLNNRQIAEKVGISAVAIGKMFDGQFPSKNISKFFAAFPDLSPLDLYGHYSDGSYKTINVSLSEVEKENERLKRDLKNLQASNNLLRLNLMGRLSDKEKELVNFKQRNPRSTALHFVVDKNMQKVGLSVTPKPKQA